MPFKDINKKRAYNNSYYRANKHRWKDVYSEWTKLNKHKLKKYQLKCRYGVTEDFINELKEKQKGVCAICQQQTNPLVIDHIHVGITRKCSKKEVRGLLCQSCNKGLGHFFDNTDYLENAIKYLRRSTLTTYKVNFEYSIPQFTEIELEAENANQAEEKANVEFAKLYPEAIDATVVLISAVTA